MAKRDCLFKIIVVSLSLVLGCGLAEVAIRFISPQPRGLGLFAYDRELGAIPIPGRRGRKIIPGVYDFTFSHNSQGLRGNREYPEGKRQGLRILLLGDSFTYGIGASDEETFARYLEKNLAAVRTPAEVINAGNPGKGTDYELRYFESRGYRLEPDLTVIYFFWNDFFESTDWEYYRLGKDEEIIPKAPHSLESKRVWVENLPVLSWLLSWSHAANLLKRATLETSDRARAAKYTTTVSPERRKMTKIFLGRLCNSIKARGSGLLLFYIPADFDVERYRESRGPSDFEATLKEIAYELGEEVISLTPAVASAPEGIGLLYRGGHWTPRANFLAAAEMVGPVADYLRPLKSPRDR